MGDSDSSRSSDRRAPQRGYGPTRHGRGAMRGVCLGRQVAALSTSHSVRRPPDAAKTLIVATPGRRPAALSADLSTGALICSQPGFM
jgi:hypothetical protein